MKYSLAVLALLGYVQGEVIPLQRNEPTSKMLESHSNRLKLKYSEPTEDELLEEGENGQKLLMTDADDHEYYLAMSIGTPAQEF